MFIGVLEEILIEAYLSPEGSPSKKYVRDPNFINGLPGYKLYLKEHISVNKSKMVKLEKTSDGTVLKFIHFPPGSTIAVR